VELKAIAAVDGSVKIGLLKASFQSHEDEICLRTDEVAVQVTGLKYD
jgi:hypothetical protein